MPNQSGVWTLSQQFQARGQGLWPAPPGAPTIGTATAGNATASVTFTAPTCTGYPAGVTSYTVTSTPGCITASGASSPISVTGLTNNTAYTFKVKAQNSSGLFGACSAASNSVTPSNAGSQSYTTAGTYSWVVPAGVTSISVVTVGGGGGGTGYPNGRGGGGGALAYINNKAVTPGQTHTVVVGTGGGNNVTGTASYMAVSCTTYVSAGGGLRGCSCGTGGSVIAGTGYSGGQGGSNGGGPGAGGGGGAGGYSGAGGKGGNWNNSSGGIAGTGGAGGGGSGGGAFDNGYCTFYRGGGGGGGVGILGQGSSGAGGTWFSTGAGGGGGGGSGGCNGVAGSGQSGGQGGAYGGGGGGAGIRYDICGNPFYGSGAGAGGGAVRIIWPGNTRSFPSTCAGNP